MEVLSQNTAARPFVVALVGRTNVGKSTLFNRLAGRKVSIVNHEPCATRDRIYAKLRLPQGAEGYLIDTGGLELESEEELDQAVLTQSRAGIAEADVIFFVVDAAAGVLKTDFEIADVLRQSGKPVIVVANKSESKQAGFAVPEFYALGFGTIVPTSAVHGTGSDELKEELYSLLLQRRVGVDFTHAEIPLNPPFAKGERNHITVAVIGKPNAGKSTFLNKLLGTDRHLTSMIPGTTVDAVDSELTYNGQQFLLIDTAGIRRKRGISREVEKMAVSASLGAIDRAEVALIMIDAEEGLTEQDMKVAAFANDKGRASIIVVNKWDLAKKKGLSADKYAQDLRDKMPFMAYAPIRFMSALLGTRVFDVLDTAIEIHAEYHKRITTSQLNRFMEGALAAHQPAVVKGRRVKIFYGTQVKSAPPTFLFSTNEADGFHFSYQRYLINRMREEFGFKGVPLRLLFRGRGEDK